MTHAELLQLAAASSRVELTFGEARDLVAAHERLLEERDALREQLRSKAYQPALFDILRNRAEFAEASDAESIAMYRRARDNRAEAAEKERDAARSSLSQLRGQAEELADALHNATVMAWRDNRVSDRFSEQLLSHAAALRSLVGESTDDHKDKGGES